MNRKTGAAPQGAGSELREHSRALTATSAGLASGFLLNHYVANLFAPHLMKAFGWAPADFALIGTVGLVNVLCIPVIGRMTDLVGSRAVALVGVVAFPLTFLAMSMMRGSIATFAALSFVQLLLCGATTSSTVYSRWVAERFVVRRGLALALAATAPALVGMIGSPLLERVIALHGWRAGYVAIAAYVSLVGGLAIAIAPRSAKGARRAPPVVGGPKRMHVYAEIARTRAFWILVLGMLLCNLVYPLQSSQMKLMLIDAGASATAATWMISLFAGGVIVGRFGCGFALDRLPAGLVAAVALALPSIGLLCLAAGATASWSQGGAVLLIGMSLGAESDLLPFLVMRFFRIDIYGAVLGLVVAAMALSTALGAVLLSATLHATETFTLYMLVAAIAGAIGSVQFLLLDTRQAGDAAGAARLAGDA